VIACPTVTVELPYPGDGSGREILRALSSSKWAPMTSHPRVLDDVVELLVACPAFVGVTREAVTGLAAGAEISYVAAVEAPVTPALRGGLIVRDRDGRSVDMVGEGEFCAPEPDERLDPVEPSLVVWLPASAIDLAWSAPPDRLRQQLVRPRSCAAR
jgi:hypothetical protein